MAEPHDDLKCPLCHGRGQISRSEILEKFSDSYKISAYVGELRKLVPLVDRRTGPQAPRPGGRRKMDFEHEVHTWNPSVDLWTRSNKE